MARINTDKGEKITVVIRCANGAAFLKIPSQASLQMSFQKPRHPGKPGEPRVFSGSQFLAIFFISRKTRKAGLLVKRVSDVFLQSRASSLVKGFENAAPAWLEQALPCASPLFVWV